MRSLINSIVIATLLAGGFLQSALASPGTSNILVPRRTSSILNSPAAQPKLPSAATVATSSLNLKDIQGDVLVGMKKKKEKFFFFKITNPKVFKTILRTGTSLLTTTDELLDVNKQPNAMVNVAFSQAGLTALNVTDDLGDPVFSGGQFADAGNLGDPGTDNWVGAFKGKNIHGVFLLASDSTLIIDAEWLTVKLLFANSITELYTLSGQSRPGDQEGHEHFGFMDGISQPGITGFTTNPVPGQAVIDPGHLLLGENGDPVTRPPWAKDGTFLAFRQLKQLVPEFNKFLKDNPIKLPGLTPEQGSQLLGARMIGRWKSGAPIDLSPFADDKDLAKDPSRNNNFNFSHPGEDLATNQTRCPFSAHIRKTAPRADLNPVDVNHHIMRAGIPYGPEVSSSEAASSTTKTERGLAFVAYQSNLAQGFQFMQRRWANSPGFVFGKKDLASGQPLSPGFDPIIGANAGQPRNVTGLDPSSPTGQTTLLIDFVQSRGGEYFFVPSISAIKNIIAKP